MTAIHNKKMLWPDYLEHFSKDKGREDFVSFLKAVGAMHQFEVIKADARQNTGMESRSSGIESSKQINIDWTIQGLEQYLKEGNAAASHMIWMALIEAEKEVAKAKYQPNQRSLVRTCESQLVRHLKSCA